MVRECMSKSPMIGVGQSFVTKFGDIRLINVYDSSSGMIGIKPNGWSEVVVHTVDWRVEDIGPMSVETNFYTMGGRGCHFWVCGPDEPAPPLKCLQTFKLQDQNGNPLNGNVQIGTTGISILGTGTIALELRKSYTAVASFSNQPTQSKTFTACTTTTFTFNVVQDVGTLSITTIPSGASISIDGKSYGVTPNLNIELPLGVHNVILKKTGYADVTKEVTLHAGIQGIISVTLVPIIVKCRQEFWVNLPAFTGFAPGATITINGVVYTTNSEGYASILLVQGKEYTAVAKHEGASYTRTFTACRASITMVLSAPPIPDTGYIKCQAYDSVTNTGLNATLRIDGNTIVPKTPHTTPALPIGSHTVSFLLAGYMPKTVTVTVKAGQTVNAYGSMVKLALPDVAGFDIKVNVPGMLPKTSLYISQVTKVPLIKTWWGRPFGHGMRWDNVSNGVFKARAKSTDSSPTPNFHTGFAGNEDYAVYVGTSAVSLFPPGIIYRSTDKVTEIDITGNYLDWVSSRVCVALDISPANCPFFIASSVNDAAFFLELWTIITKHKNLAGETTLPTALDYALLPIAIFGMLSPGISEGKIVQTVGKRITELIPLSKKGTTEIKAVMQHPDLDTFLLRASDIQFKDFVRYIDDGLDVAAKNLLKAVDDAPLSKNDLHALQRAANFVEELDPKLTKAGSIENLKTVLKNFNPAFTKAFENALKWVTEHPSETVTVGSAGIVLVGLWYALSKLTGNVDDSFKASGITMSSTSWGGKDYLANIEIYKYNVIDAERLKNWTLFCESLLAWENEVNNFEVFVTANQAKLNVEGYYGIFTNSIAAYRKAIEIKNEVHTCIETTLPDVLDAEVMEILDGDTVIIKYLGKEHEVRFLGINTVEGSKYEYQCTGVKSPFLIRRLVTPGKNCIEEETWTGTEEMYNDSKVWLSQMLPVHQIARFRSDTARQFDMYGRLLAVPFYNDKNICRESLKAGQSAVFFYDDNTRVDKTRFLASEKIAKDAKIGIWAVEAGLGTIRCVSNPTAAEVWLDGEYTGKKTISSVAYLSNVPVGIHTIEFKKIIDGVSHTCSKSVGVTKDGTALAECTLVSGEIPTPTPTPDPTPTPIPPTEKATWQINDVKNEAGAILGAAKVYVDDIYVKHYAPESLTFCTGCSCDTVVPCGFGSHTVTIKKTGYQDWNKTRTLGSGDNFTDNPIMKLIPSGTYPVTLLSQPSGATIKVDGMAI